MAEPKHRTPGQIISCGHTRLVRVYVGKDVNGKRIYINRTVKGGAKSADKVLSDLLETVSGGSPVGRPALL